MNPFTEILAGLTIVSIVSAAIFIVLGNRKKQKTQDSTDTDKLYNENIAQLKLQNELLKEAVAQKVDELKEQADRHERDRAEWAAGHLESQKAISKLEGQVQTLSTLQLNKISDTLIVMEDLLQTSASTLATDTAAAAIHVAEVKTDLEK